MQLSEPPLDKFYLGYLPSIVLVSCLRILTNSSFIAIFLTFFLATADRGAASFLGFASFFFVNRGLLATLLFGSHSSSSSSDSELLKNKQVNNNACEKNEKQANECFLTQKETNRTNK